jgi:hypothetical protein
MVNKIIGMKIKVDGMLADQKLVQSRFDLNKSFSKLIGVYYSTYGKEYPAPLKKRILKVKKMWASSEYVIFEILASHWLEKEILCPKCNLKNQFTATRYKKIEKLIKIQKCVRSERPRTITCSNCSFTLNPLGFTSYRGLKIDLRKHVFYLFMTDDGKIEFPISDICEILDVSNGTAKKIKSFYSGEEGDSTGRAEKYISKGEDHALVKFLLNSIKDDIQPGKII